jgi:hypothetical protein
MDTAETSPSVSREEILHKYRRWRQLRTDIQSAALKNVALPTFLKGAKRIGIADGKTLIANSDSEVMLAYDLALYSTGAGKTRAIDRYARSQPQNSDPDETLMLEALRASRFSWFRVIEKPEAAGVRLKDLMRGGELWLLDEGLEQSVRPGDFLATRVAPVEGYVITCGAVVPFDQQMAADMEIFLAIEGDQATYATLADNWRFAEQVYRMAVKRNLMSRIKHQ